MLTLTREDILERWISLYLKEFMTICNPATLVRGLAKDAEAELVEEWCNVAAKSIITKIYVEQTNSQYGEKL